MPVAGEVHVSVLFGCSSLKTEDNLTAVKAVPSDRILLETGTYVHALWVEGERGFGVR